MQIIIKRIQDGKATSKDLFKAIDDEVNKQFLKKKKKKKKYFKKNFYIYLLILFLK
jgi:hypothetical protein